MLLIAHKGLGVISILGGWHLHEIGVVILSEILLNKKHKSMKDLIAKISVHLMISGFLTNLGHVIMNVGGQAIPFDRLFQHKYDCKCA